MAHRQNRKTAQLQASVSGDVLLDEGLVETGVTEDAKQVPRGADICLDEIQRVKEFVEEEFPKFDGNVDTLTGVLAQVYSVRWEIIGDPVPHKLVRFVKDHGFHFYLKSISWLVEFVSRGTAVRPSEVKEWIALLDDARERQIKPSEIREWLTSIANPTPVLDPSEVGSSIYNDHENDRSASASLRTANEPKPGETAADHRPDPEEIITADPEGVIAELGCFVQNIRPMSALDECAEVWPALSDAENENPGSDAVRQRESRESAASTDQPGPEHATAADLSGPEETNAADELEPEQCFEQNIKATTAGPEFEEGPQIRQDSDRDTFSTLFREAQRLETEIAQIERELDHGEKEGRSHLDPKVMQQVTVVFEMVSSVQNGTVPQRIMEEVVAEAGIRGDRRDKYPWSPLMRAVAASGDIKGTRRSRRKQTRVSTCAAAVHTAISTGMTADDFKMELTHPPVRGEKHGLYHLADEARKAQRVGNEEKGAKEISEVLAGLDKGGGYRVSGNFGAARPGIHLVAIKVPEDTTQLTETFGQIVEPDDDALIQRLLGKWIKSRSQ